MAATGKGIAGRWWMRAVILLLGTAVCAPFAGAAGLEESENILMIVLDDVGVDVLDAYAEVGSCAGGAQPCISDDDCTAPETCESDHARTPTIDRLATEGTLFRTAWATPTCSPSRATILTGRYGFRTGVMSPYSDNGVLPPEELTIPEVLGDPFLNPHLDYASAAFGKWHLFGGLDAPNDQGFDHYAGSLDGAVADYFNWDKTVNGVTVPCGGQNSACPDESYATSVNVTDATDWIQQQTSPWFVYLALNAPHQPFQVPPHELLSVETRARLPIVWNAEPAPAGTFCGVDDTRICFLAMLEAVDTEIDRLWSSLPANTTIIFIADNGTPGWVKVPAALAGHAKGTLYEGGINVPLIIRDAAQRSPGSESTALVSGTDLFLTVLELAGANAPRDRAIDSRSLIPLLDDPGATVWDMVFSQSLNGQALRDPRFKLIRRENFEEFYDLAGDPPGIPPDPFEQFDRLLGTCPESEPCHVDQDCPSGGECTVPAQPPVVQDTLAELRAQVDALLNPSGRVPDGSLRVDRATDGRLELTWTGSCAAGDLDYQVFEGLLGDFDSHTAKTCSTEGGTSALVDPAPDDTYYLVVPTNNVSEGSHGITGDGTPRAGGTCLPRCWAECAP